MLTYGSVCSGIEAASVAWEPLGMVPEWFAQFDPEHDYNKGPDFPSAVLAHHWPHVPNLGDMTKIAEMLRGGAASAPDILVGGTPCQAFSVAGMRKGLDDTRGQLTLKFVEIADEIDKQRGAGNECAILWENVPGVLSSKDNAFGCFLAGLVGEDCELVPPGGKWSNAGCVSGPKRTVAWRILDAQYFGVAQRRRRVFVVASARKDFDPTAVLFEREGVRRDTAPSRETGSVVAALTANGVGTCGADDNQGQAGRLIAVHGTQDPDTNTELAHTLGRNHGQENAVCVTGTVTHTLKAEGFDGSEDGTGRGQPIVPAYSIRTANTSSNGWGIREEVTHTIDTATAKSVAYSVALRGREGGATAELGDEVAGCLRASTGGGDKPHVLTSEPTPINLQVITRHESLGRGTGFGLGESGEAAYTLGAEHTHGIWSGLAVRRLTPVECERLQGFPDGHTAIPYRHKPAADGHRYKALGNSMAVCCMEWIGRRLAAALGEDDPAFGLV